MAKKYQKQIAILATGVISIASNNVIASNIGDSLTYGYANTLPNNTAVWGKYGTDTSTSLIEAMKLAAINASVTGDSKFTNTKKHLDATYAEYIAAARPDNHTEKTSTLELQIAKAMLGLDPNMTLPAIIRADVEPKIYIYKNASKATTKAKATQIEVATATTIENPREGFSDDATYFIAPAILNTAPSPAKTWTVFPTGTGLPTSIPKKYILQTVANEKLNELNAAYKQYDGMDFQNGSVTAAAANIAAAKITAAIEDAAQCETKEAYAKVVATIRTYVDKIIPSVAEIITSSKDGADVPATLLWTSDAHKRKIVAVADDAASFLDEHVADPNVSNSLSEALEILAYTQVEYQKFYGHNIKGEKLEITPYVQAGTEGIELANLRAAIQVAIESINNLSYLPGATPPATTYTDQHGLSGAAYQVGAGDIHVSNKSDGVDVPLNTRWIYIDAVENFANEIAVAQKSLQSSDQSDAVQAEAALTKAVANFVASEHAEKNVLTPAALAYNEALSNLNAAITQAYTTIGLATGESGPLALPHLVKLSILGDGSDIDSGTKWINTNQFNSFKAAIDNAQKLLSTATTAQLNRSFKTLKRAAANLVSNIKRNGDGKSAKMLAQVEILEETISVAHKILFGADGRTPVFASATGRDVPNDSLWMAPSRIAELNHQIDLAKATLANISTTTLKTIYNNIRSLRTSIASANKLLKLGTLDANSGAAYAAKSRVRLIQLIDQAAQYTRYATSDDQGVDVDDGIIWITEEDIDHFITHEGDEKSMSPKDFIEAEHKVAAAALKANVYINARAATNLATAVAHIESAIKQFELVLSNRLPNDSADAPAGVLYSGVGVADSLAKAVTGPENSIAYIEEDTDAVAEVDDDAIAKYDDGEFTI
ncbi:hypothetical protein [Candidatus Epulonipiscium viviparus]|uniref:hypothetical protein n=1 Tax=Candidatus Epulonipiscium viviparus TaxID=420336 RepID=UPI00273806BB|nr:hypothetical protein [Candidatus Epulopiscium viviparus]